MAIDSSSISICWLGEIQSSAKRSFKCCWNPKNGIPLLERRQETATQKQLMIYLKKNTNEQKREIVPGSKTGYVNCEVPSLLMCGLGVWEWTYLCVCYCFGFFSVCLLYWLFYSWFFFVFIFVCLGYSMENMSRTTNTTTLVGHPWPPLFNFQSLHLFA